MMNRKEKNQLQHLYEQRYCALFECTTDAVLLFNSEDTIIEINHVTSDLMGYSKDEIVGQKLSYFTKPDENGEYRHKKIIAEPVQVFPLFELVFLKREGTEYQVKVDLVPVSDPDGHVIYYQSILHDLTDQKKVKDENRKFTKIIETTSQSVIITNIKGTVLYVNTSYYTFSGYVEDEVIGKSMFRFAYKKGALKLAKEVVPALLKRGHWRGEMSVVTKDKQVVFVDLICSLLSNEKNRPEYFVAIFSDITKQKKYEEEILKLKSGLEVQVAEKTKELKEKVSDLQRFFDATVDRELRMKELSDENEKLKAELKKQ